jgi:periplasmic divalent cation tolerance protein
MTLPLRRETSRSDVLHPVDGTDGGSAILLDDQHGPRPYTPDAPWYSPRVLDAQAPSDDDAPLVLLTTLPNVDKAAAVARILVEESLCACVNLVPAVRSIYRWQGQVSDQTETLVIIKTIRRRYDALAARLVSLHPYDVPELIAVQPVGGHAPYLAWITDSVR